MARDGFLREQGAAAAGLLLSAALLTLQFGLTLHTRMAVNDGNLVEAIVFFFSFFTVLSNVGVMLAYLSAINRSRYLEWFGLHRTRTMLAALILIVMAVYHFVLAPIWNPTGWNRVADVGLHYVTPMAYLIWWLSLRREGALPFASVVPMALPALVYGAYVLLRGGITGLYPYPFIDARALGTAGAVQNMLALTAAMFVVFALFIAVDRALARRIRAE